MERGLDAAGEKDSKLLEDFARGDVDAFEQLFRQFQHQVYGWIVRIVRDPAAAEDLTVEAFWRTYRARRGRALIRGAALPPGRVASRPT
jgi:RNA polymerase sigma-70 factor (ECF subfamily)